MWTRTGLVLLVVLGLDQLTKALVRGGVDVGSEDGIFPGVTLVHSKNRGVAFSALEGKTGIVSIVIAIAVIALLVYVARNAAVPGIWIPAGLLTGGAVGNIIDRIAEGAVTDFIKLPRWPAFNVADMAITFGVLALLYVMDRGAKADEAAAAGAQQHPGVHDAADSRS